MSRFQEFDVILRHAEFASNQLWQIFQIFILAHTILIAFIGATFSRFVLDNSESSKLYLISVLVLGIFMSIMWLGAYLRTRGYYDFRLAQANEKEKSLKLLLLRERGEDFAEGKCVEIEKKHYQMTFLARLLRMRRTMPFFIVLFLVFYLFLLLNTLGFNLNTSILLSLAIAIIAYCSTRLK